MPEVNWLAVLVAAIANMVLGFIWYGPLFGSIWADLMGWGNISPEKKEAMMKSMSKSYILTFIGSLLTAFVLSHLIQFSQSFGNPEGLNTGLMTAFWIWLGITAPLTLGSVIWEGKSWKLWFLNNGYNLLNLLIIGAIVSTWR